MSATIKVFAYGTLKSTETSSLKRFAACESDVVFIGRAVTRRRYAMYDNGAYPVVKDFPEVSPIHGELYRVSERILRQLDAYEDNGILFQRLPIPVVDTEGTEHLAYMYFYLGETEDLIPIPDGIWSGRI